MSLCAHCTDNAALAKVSLGGILNVKGGGGGGVWGEHKSWSEQVAVCPPSRLTASASRSLTLGPGFPGYGSIFEMSDPVAPWTGDGVQRAVRD